MSGSIRAAAAATVVFAVALVASAPADAGIGYYYAAPSYYSAPPIYYTPYYGYGYGGYPAYGGYSVYAPNFGYGYPAYGYGYPTYGYGYSGFGYGSGFRPSIYSGGFGIYRGGRSPYSGGFGLSFSRFR